MHACAVCVELPEASIADHILSAEVIVLAGAAPDNPFRFSVQKILRGTEGQLETIPEIPFLIDSVTRRAFHSDPTKTVLLTYGAIYKDSTGRSFSRGWKRIFTMNPERIEFVERLRPLGVHWIFGATDTPDRVSFFAEYLWHPDHVLHNIAMIEIGRAPYDLVRPIGDRVSTRRIMEEFNNLNRFRYVPVAIRLLGLQTDPQAVSIVRSRFAKTLKAGGPNTFEWALAGIETDGASAIRAIGRVIQDSETKLEHRQSLIRALSEAGTVQPKHRDEILGIFSEALGKDPRLAIRIAVAARNWGQTGLHPLFEAIAAKDETDPATQFVLNLVLGSQVRFD
ncbi:hypothetical protein RKLH11_1666 [Rhodobacteraceae bacterium KLH11]|nr:hypothetical protein RKLH11_1666 [Rhodobacteraceae bacterium KLH11]